MAAPLDFTPLLKDATSEEVVIRNLLIRNAEQAPDATFARFEDGATWTRRETLEEASRAANVLRAHGVTQGDCVAIMLPNGADFLRAWFGAALIGAAILPINTAFVGTMLARPFELASPRLVVTDATLGARFDDLPGLGETSVMNSADLSTGEPILPEIDRPIRLSDTDKMIMTSGTTGPSKLAEVAYLFSYAAYTAILWGQDFGPDDVFQIDFPLFHAAALGYVNGCLSTGAGISVRSRPALDDYWGVAREAGVTGSLLISSLLPAMMNRPPSPSDRDHRVRFMVTAPIPPDIAEFKQRFGVQTVLASYGSTETGAPLLGEARPGQDPAFCGRERPGWEIMLVDEYDQEVPVGEVGEAIVRGSRPYIMSPGYVNDPLATAVAWRNGWFHTGDLLRKNADGEYSFVDRTKDAIRRRGENISAYEVERALEKHPDINEISCVAVESDSGVEHEIKAWIVPREGAVLDFADLLRFAVGELPHFMVPRYYETIDAIPKTPTGKPQKFELRARQASAAEWDYTTNGFSLTRHGLRTITSV